MQDVKGRKISENLGSFSGPQSVINKATNTKSVELLSVGIESLESVELFSADKRTFVERTILKFKTCN